MKQPHRSGHPGGVPSEALARSPLEGAAPARLTAGELFRAHAAFVAAFVLRLGVARAAVDDVVQEVFLTAYRRGGFEQGAARPTTWLAEIAVRVVSTHKRTERRRRVIPDESALDHAIAPADSPHEIAEQRDALGRVQRALDALDVERRAVFVLYELMGESCEDIASGLGIPVGTVHSRLFNARREFQKAYSRIDRGSDEPVRRASGGEL